MEPLITVIIPVYKTEKYLARCVDSVINQSYKNLEILLVDDGSPDNCGLLCDEYAKNDARIKVIHKENGGLSSARNVGIDAAKGDIISFIDSDDYIDAKMYELMVAYMLDNDLDIACCDTTIVRGSSSKFKPRYRENKIFINEQGINEILSGSLDNSACNKIFKRECIRNIRFPLGRHYEDVATIYLYVSNASRVGYIAKGFYYYIKNSAGIVGQSFNSKSRYDCFLGYKERLEYAENKALECVEDCRKNAVETALATMTAFYATGESEYSDRFKDVEFLLDNSGRAFKKRMRTKHHFLLWAHFNMKSLHKLYANLSRIAKK